MSGLLALFIFGCVVESQSAASPPARFEGVELTDSEGHRWAADRATMGPDGLGRGEGVDAALGVDGDGERVEETWRF